MNPRVLIPVLVQGVLATLCIAAPDMSGWKASQPVELPAPGIVRVPVDPGLLGEAQPGLRDLRLLDAEGREIAFAEERPAPAVARETLQPLRFTPRLDAGKTVLVVESGTDKPLSLLRLLTPSGRFLKSAMLEGSQAPSGEAWEVIGRGIPVFRERQSEDLDLDLGGRAWSRLRVTFEDTEQQPAVPFQGALVVTGGRREAESATQPWPVLVAERQDGGSQSRIELDLGNANLLVSSLHLGIPESAFHRRATLSYRVMDGDQPVERELTRTVLARLPGESVDKPLEVFLGQRVPSRTLVLSVENGSSPPLGLSKAAARVRPVVLLAESRGAGMATLYAGNPRASAPSYDLRALGSLLQAPSAPVAASGALAMNPSWTRPALPDFMKTGAPLDASAWRHSRRLVAGDPDAPAAQWTLDAEVLSLAASDLSDLRIVRDGVQIPYVLERIATPLDLDVELAEPKGNPKPGARTVWTITLPYKRLPVRTLCLETQAPAFDRWMRVDEVRPDVHGSRYTHPLGGGHFVRRETQSSAHAIGIAIDGIPQGDVLQLAVDDGDNARLPLSRARVTLPRVRVIFPNVRGDDLRLYYGNPKAHTPRYDVQGLSRLLLDEVRSPVEAEPASAPGRSRGASQQDDAGGPGGWLLWVGLGAVVVVLLLLMRAFLPKATAGDGEDK